MKVAVVPAQVTTVEDRIVGSLGFSQLVLIVSPVFIAALLFAILPPFMGSAIYKYVIMGVLAFLCCLLAIRIKGKIVAAWLVVILRYNLRPKYYLFDKNVTTLRADYPVRQNKQEEITPVETKKHTARPRLGIPETAIVLAAIDNPAAKVRFETGKKGNLHVRLTEIEK
jgi:hypothetical protein